METAYRFFIFWLGGTVYQSLELFWRKKTHPSMFAAGGTAALGIDAVCNGVLAAFPLLVRCIAGGLVITGVEFLFGCIVNLRMGKQVWDYSAYPLQILGQICLHNSVLWCILSLPAITVLQELRRWIAI